MRFGLNEDAKNLCNVQYAVAVAVLLLHANTFDDVFPLHLLQKWILFEQTRKSPQRMKERRAREITNKKCNHIKKANAHTKAIKNRISSLLLYTF